MSPWDLLDASNRLIDSSWNLQRDSCIPKALPADQSQPTSSGYTNYYAARWLNWHCKYMSRKTIAFWAMGCVPLSRVSNREPFTKNKGLQPNEKNWMRCKVVIGKVLQKKKKRKKERQHREHIPLSSIHVFRLQISGSNFCSCFLTSTADFVTVGRSFSVSTRLT